MTKISAFIIAKNEAQRITLAINSMKDIVDEVLVIDSGSNDDTVKIAENLGAKVVYNEWHGYVKQKSFGEQLCKHDWILNIDADEELSPELQKEIKEIFNPAVAGDRKRGSNHMNLKEKDDVSPNAMPPSSDIIPYKAYRIKVTILHRKDKRARRFAPVNQVIRLYNRKFCSFSNTKNTTTHDSVTFNEDMDNKNSIFNLKNRVYHRSGTSIEQLINKANSYSTEQAKDMVSACRKPSILRIVCELSLCFFKAFVIRRYFVFGIDGFVDSVIFAFARFARIAKTREMYSTKHKIDGNSSSL